MCQTVNDIPDTKVYGNRDEMDSQYRSHQHLTREGTWVYHMCHHHKSDNNDSNAYVFTLAGLVLLTELNWERISSKEDILPGVCLGNNQHLVDNHSGRPGDK